MSEKCGELVTRCFQARTEAHIAHLLTRSYAEHKALDDFYNEIVELADAYAEAAQGRYGLLTYPASPKIGDVERPLTIPVGLRNWIDKNRAACGGTELKNLIDEITSQCDSTAYKLRFLS
jgi:hypothetical protein